MKLDDNIVYLKGVGPARAKALQSELGLTTLGDLLDYLPFRHIDQSTTSTIGALTADSGPVLLRGRQRTARAPPLAPPPRPAARTRRPS